METKLGFNSRAHKGRDNGHTTTYQTFESFNSRAHKGRDDILVNQTQASKFQFTRPQGARPMFL